MVSKKLTENFDFSVLRRNKQRRDYALIGTTALATSIILILFINLFSINLDFNSANNNNLSEGGNSSIEYPNTNQSGQVILTEEELKSEVSQIPVPVYWVGPIANSKYTLENQANGRIFVRYLLDGKLPATGEATKRVIGTYRVANAFQTTKSAATSVANAVGVTGADGEAIFYIQNNPKNVYVAFPNVEAQIEIFDPETGVSLKLATQKGLVQVIK